MRRLPNEAADRLAPDREAPWPRSRQHLGIAIWSSFLAAAGASVVCFAIVDPAALDLLSEAEPAFARMSGYAFGFFLIWAATAGASLLTLYLLRTAHSGTQERTRTHRRESP